MIVTVSLWPALIGYFAGLWIAAVRHKHHHRTLTSREWLRALLDWLSRH